MSNTAHHGLKGADAMIAPENSASSGSCADNGTHQSQHIIRKKRLSRKEQKARKKQQQQKKKKISSVSPLATTTSTEIRVNDTKDVEDCLATYVPTPIPTFDELPKQKSTSLGKWFPKAVVLKSAAASSSSFSSLDSDSNSPQASLLLFYQYVTPPWSESRVSLLMAYLTRIAETRQTLGGRIRVAPEGVNATISSVDSSTSSSSKTTLQHFIQDLKLFDKVFGETDFKHIGGLHEDRHFKDFKILPVKELVFYGINDAKAPLDKGGVHLDPEDFHKMLGGDHSNNNKGDGSSTVVVDVRNHYEAQIGRFDGQQETSSAAKDNNNNNNNNNSTAAEYVDPRMRKSTDFPNWLAKPSTQEKLKNKTVLLYCTGGVRCERASAYLNQQMGSQLKGVYQLKGGIERYLQAYPDGGFWRGKNYVFDKREAISPDNRNGDGGVIGKMKKKHQTSQSVEEHHQLATTCCVCNAPWDRYVGKKKCDTCGVPVLMCDACMSGIKKKRKTFTTADTVPMVRCSLCVEENITVPVEEVEYTDNGVSGRVLKHGGEDNDAKEEAKAAPSVLKWGGGHASQKKNQRRFKRKLCKFGTDCVRKDCFFAHPERKQGRPAKKGATNNT